MDWSDADAARPLDRLGRRGGLVEQVLHQAKLGHGRPPIGLLVDGVEQDEHLPCYLFRW